ncbi:hypothetical protein EV421DRAFT_1912913 [Armillaria borealis]|uniref:Uncharacterized protein n=1 Tax=Armillaria borealis TaxID=47425 RepID=A0AA39ITZ6_9AGAR|nr:hypothetical protein EV421DRAFT_1912913 [Armillaria borealis]
MDATLPLIWEDYPPLILFFLQWATTAALLLPKVASQVSEIYSTHREPDVYAGVILLGSLRRNYNALMWAITDDEAHARKDIEMLTGWASVLRLFVVNGTDTQLAAGRQDSLWWGFCDIWESGHMNASDYAAVAAMFFRAVANELPV